VQASDRIYVAGHTGMVGSAVCRELRSRGYQNLITRSHRELDLTDQAATRAFIQREKPDCIIFAAARVGGIEANRSLIGTFLYENLMASANVIHAAHETGVHRLLFLGSTCIYPRLAPQPIPEESLLTGPLEPTNEGYALAKIAGLKMCAYYRQQFGRLYHSAMPTNLYGPGDNYHPAHSHVLPALIRRFEEARLAKDPSVTIWGTGTPLREFLHVEDLARGLLFLLEQENPPDWVNVGSGQEVSIRDLAVLVKEATGFQGELHFDPSMPDGTPRKICDTTRIRKLGWKPQVPLGEGIKRTVGEYRAALAAGTLRS
jgi:GDP-L-fucose synthase